MRYYHQYSKKWKLLENAKHLLNLEKRKYVCEIKLTRIIPKSHKVPHLCEYFSLAFAQRIAGNLKLLRKSINADRKRLKTAFSIANCRFRLSICNLKRCFNAYRSALVDSRDSSRLPPIRCDLCRHGVGVRSNVTKESLPGRRVKFPCSLQINKFILLFLNSKYLNAFQRCLSFFLVPYEPYGLFPFKNYLSPCSQKPLVV